MKQIEDIDLAEVHQAYESAENKQMELEAEWWNCERNKGTDDTEEMIAKQQKILHEWWLIERWIESQLDFQCLSTTLCIEAMQNKANEIINKLERGDK
jgi:hypothetical protein